MSDQSDPTAGPAGAGREPTEEELRAAYQAQLEEQLKQLRVEDVLVQTIVTLINVGGRKAGLAPGTEGERDPEQLRLAIEGARALLPLIEGQLGPDGATIRDALSQLQMAYSQLATATGGTPQGGAGQGGEQEPSSGPGPAQSSGRLWVPGQ
jgi:hypothetical protein